MDAPANGRHLRRRWMAAGLAVLLSAGITTAVLLGGYLWAALLVGLLLLCPLLAGERASR